MAPADTVVSATPKDNARRLTAVAVAVFDPCGLMHRTFALASLSQGVRILVFHLPRRRHIARSSGRPDAHNKVAVVALSLPRRVAPQSADAAASGQACNHIDRLSVPVILESRPPFCFLVAEAPPFAPARRGADGFGRPFSLTHAGHWSWNSPCEDDMPGYTSPGRVTNFAPVPVGPGLFIDSR